MGGFKDRLGDRPYGEVRPPSSRHGTSEDAADSMRDSAAGMRRRIHDLAIARGLQGLTCSEAETLLDMHNENSVHPRFWELETESEAPAAQRIREVQPRVLFVVDRNVATGRIARPSAKSGRGQLVYFAAAAVSFDEVLAHYGLARRREGP